MHYLFEAILVGLATAIVGFIISTLMMSTQKDFSVVKYHFWWQVVLSFFITGAFLHIGFELLGWNASYCEYKKVA